MCGKGNYMSSREAAEYVGYSFRHFKRLVADGTIPFTKPRGRLFFRRLDLDRFINNEL